MSTFAYIARNSDGRRVTGTSAAGSEQGVLAELEAKQLSAVRIDRVSERSLQRGGKVGRRQLAVAYRQLADLLRAGVPLLRSLRLVGRNKSTPALSRVFTQVADGVSEGERLADAMGAHPKVFPDVQVAMVRAGERGGFLEQVLARLATFIEYEAEMRSKVVGSLVYPALLLIVMLCVIIGCLVFFVPKFEPFFARMDPPMLTKMLITISHVLQESWLLVALGTAALAGGTWWALRQPGLQRSAVTQLMRLPKAGPLFRALSIARFTRLLGTLLENGVPLLAAMQISREAAGNPLLVDAIAQSTEAVRAGEALADPLRRSGLFPEDVLEMITIGEAANALPSVLLTISDTIEARIDRMLKVLLRLIEPVMLLGIAGLVLLLFIALVLPMMRMSTAM